MSTLLSLALPFAGCALMMLVCSRMMRRGTCQPAKTDASHDEVAQLRAEIAELRAARDEVPS